MALGLLYDGLVDRIFLNDLDRDVHAFWWSALHETDALCRKVVDTAVTVEEWDRQQEVRRDPTVGAVELGFATFFLNRTNRSGVLNAGMIGGRQQTSAYGIDARYNKTTLVQRLEKVGRHRGRIHLSNLDAIEFLRTVVPEMRPRSLVYLDPPYFGQGQRLYLNAYDFEDHRAIASLVPTIERPWVVSYDAVPEIAALYGGWPSRRYGLAYSAADHYRGTEVMFFPPTLSIPEVAIPTRVSFGQVDEARLELVRGSA